MEDLIVAVCDSNFTQGAKGLANSLRENAGRRLTLISYGLTSREKDGIDADHAFRQPPHTELWSVLARNARTAWFMGITMYLPEAFPDARRILYLDCDILCVGPLDDLFAVDMGDSHLGAVPRDHNPRRFNAGVQLMDCEKWRERKVGDELTAAIVRDGGRCTPQTSHNKVEEDRYCRLPKKYNVFPASEDVPDDAVILHFKGVEKPWLGNLPIFKHGDKVLHEYYGTPGGGEGLERVLASA